jgi:hypothetical protein
VSEQAPPPEPWRQEIAQVRAMVEQLLEQNREISAKEDDILRRIRWVELVARARTASVGGWEDG